MRPWLEKSGKLSFEVADSFGSAGEGLPMESRVIEIWQRERDLLEKTLDFLPLYPRAVKDLKRGKDLSFPLAASLALLESSALYLCDPFARRFNPRTFSVFRTLRFLEAKGELLPSALNGNILLIGAGDIVPETASLDFQVYIRDRRLLRSAAQDFLSLNDHTFVDIAKGRNCEKDELGLIISAVGKARKSLVMRRRISDGQRIIAIEPDQFLFNQAREMVWAGHITPEVEVFGGKLGDYLTEYSSKGYPASYSAILNIRADPKIWSSTRAELSYVVSQRGSAAEVVRGDLGQEALNRSLKIQYDTLLVLARLLPVIENNGQFLVTIGAGNNKAEALERGFLIGMLHKLLGLLEMNPYSCAIDEMSNMASHWPAELAVKIGDIGMVIGRKSLRTQRRLESLIEKSEEIVSS